MSHTEVPHEQILDAIADVREEVIHGAELIAAAIVLASSAAPQRGSVPEIIRDLRKLMDETE